MLKKNINVKNKIKPKTLTHPQNYYFTFPSVLSSSPPSIHIRWPCQAQVRWIWPVMVGHGWIYWGWVAHNISGMGCSQKGWYSLCQHLPLALSVQHGRSHRQHRLLSFFVNFFYQSYSCFWNVMAGEENKKTKKLTNRNKTKTNYSYFWNEMAGG